MLTKKREEAVVLPVMVDGIFVVPVLGNMQDVEYKSRGSGRWSTEEDFERTGRWQGVIVQVDLSAEVDCARQVERKTRAQRRCPVPLTSVHLPNLCFAWKLLPGQGQRRNLEAITVALKPLRRSGLSQALANAGTLKRAISGWSTMTEVA